MVQIHSPRPIPDTDQSTLAVQSLADAQLHAGGRHGKVRHVAAVEGKLDDGAIVDDGANRGGKYATLHPGYYRDTVLLDIRATDHGNLLILAAVLPATYILTAC